MDLPTMTMDYGAAYEKVDQYERAVREGRAMPGDVELLDAYRSMRRGNALLDVLEAFRSTGVDHAGRPRLALIRADARECDFRLSMGTVEFRIPGGQWRRKTSRIVRIPSRVFPASVMQAPRASADVPLIPPDLRPKAKLERYHILWEAAWRPDVPKDPFLLQHVAGWLYRVCGQWDLTPVEQAVLRAARFQ